MQASILSKRIRACLLDHLIVLVLVFIPVLFSRIHSVSADFATQSFYCMALVYLFFGDGIGGASFSKRIYKIQVMSLKNLKPAGMMISFLRRVVLFTPVIGFIDAGFCVFAKSGRLVDGFLETTVTELAPTRFRKRDWSKLIVIFFLIFLLSFFMSRPESARVANLPLIDQLAAATEASDITTMTNLLSDTHLNVNQVDHLGRLPLAIAALTGNNEVFELLLVKNANPCLKTNLNHEGGESVLNSLLRESEVQASAHPEKIAGWKLIKENLQTFRCK